VWRLRQEGIAVLALVRRTSNGAVLRGSGPRSPWGDLRDIESLMKACSGCRAERRPPWVIDPVTRKLRLRTSFCARILIDAPVGDPRDCRCGQVGAVTVYIVREELMGIEGSLERIEAANLEQGKDKSGKQ
jgi:hypothetical protein